MISYCSDNIRRLKIDCFQWIKNDLWPNPLPYYLDSEMSDVENGVSSDDDVQHINDDSVVIVGDDTDDDGMFLMKFSYQMNSNL